MVLGVTGGIAAYKAVEVCRRLVDDGAFVSPVLTDGALRFVGATTFSALASRCPRSNPSKVSNETLGIRARSSRSVRRSGSRSRTRVRMASTSTAVRF